MSRESIWPNQTPVKFTKSSYVKTRLDDTQVVSDRGKGGVVNGTHEKGRK